MFTFRSMFRTTMLLLVIAVGLTGCASTTSTPPAPETTPTLVPLPSATAALTDTPQPTATDRATNTVRPPTNTPRPAATAPSATRGAPAQSAGPDPVVLAAGDIACDPANPSFKDLKGTATSCHMLAVSDIIGRVKPDAVLMLGDYQYSCGGYAAALKSYDPTWGRSKSFTFPTVGNHEYLTSPEGNVGTGCDASNAGANGYFRYFGARAGVQGKGYYSFDLGAWHLIALNTQCSDAGGCGTGSPQETWLQADLAAHPSQCTLAFWHIPLWSSGGRANKNSSIFVQDLYDSGADLVLTGHDHIYERFAPQDPSGKSDTTRGIREFVVGTGGANHTDFAEIFPNSEVRDNTSFGVLKLTLHPTSYDWQFLPEPGGGLADSGSQACH